ncbi:peroxide stress protein YaaA [Candidatus Woesearchaeota archaeon]|nr:peroxide stress protein YaaA [Candidatus Woesearchaeota archaeon]
MIVLLASSKTLNLEKLDCPFTSSPLLLAHAKSLLTEFKNYSALELQQKMKISSKLADQTYSWFKDATLLPNVPCALPAILMFEGMVFKYIDVGNYSLNELEFAQKHLRILSGLYGILRPLDLIEPYRLEMALVTNYWKEAVPHFLVTEKDDVIVNLASQEYYNVVGKTGKKVITPVFKEYKNGEYKIITIFTKFARGMMANWIIKNKIVDPQKLKEFSEGGYSYSPELSEGDLLIFTRN